MLLLEGKNSKVLCDPWITFNNQSISGFYNFPKCSYTQKQVTEIKPDFIYISHTHPDHYDPPTLSLFDKNTPILVADYDINFTDKMLRNIGFKDVRVVCKKEGNKLNADDKIWVEPSLSNPEVDSIAVFKIDGIKAINANDNVFHEAQCKSITNKVKGIDVGLIPSASHGPFPMFFENFTDNEKEILSEQRSLKLKNTFVDYIKSINPKYVVPIAGGVIAYGNKAKLYSYSGISGRKEVVDYALKKVDFIPILLSEGNSYDFAVGKKFGQYIEKIHSEETEYIQELCNIPSNFGPNGFFYIAPHQRTDLSRLLKLARTNQIKWQNIKNTISKIVYFFDVGESELYRLSLGDDTVKKIKEENITDDKYEIYRMPYELLLGMLIRQYIWSNINTQYISFYRKNSDGADKDLLLLMNFLHV